MSLHLAGSALVKTVPTKEKVAADNEGGNRHTCSNTHRTADGVVHAAGSEEVAPNLQEGEAVTQVATTDVVQVPYKYRALQCVAGYRIALFSKMEFSARWTTDWKRGVRCGRYGG